MRVCGSCWGKSRARVLRVSWMRPEGRTEVLDRVRLAALEKGKNARSDKYNTCFGS